METQSYTFTAVVNWRGGEYYAFCLDVPATGAGETIEAAIAALKEDASGYLEEPLPSCVRFSILTLEVAASYRGAPVQTHSFTAVIWLHDRWFVAISPEVGTASQGKTFEHAIDMIKEATQLYLEEMPNPNYGHPQVINFELTANVLEVARA